MGAVMPIAREPIFEALFALINTAVASQAPTVSRRFQLASAVQTAMQPAVFQVEKNERVERTRGLNAKYHLAADIVIYVQSGINDTSVIPSVALNGLLDAIDAAMQPNPVDPMHNQTLGGLVEHAWIEGETMIFEGTLQGQSVAIVPIHLYVTG
jgi:hypothetical protein